MPQIFRIGPYVIYFWSNENDPLEPIHVHVAEGDAVGNATKIWITRSGKALVCNNNSQIPTKVLGRIRQLVEANSEEIISKWLEHFGEISYFC